MTGIALLGPMAVDGDGRADPVSPAPRDRVVLAALALRPGQVVSVERLADAVWGEQPPVSWNRVIPGCVMRLRRVLGAAAIETTPHGYRLTVAGDEIDSQRFERMVGRGRELLAIGDPERAGYVLGEALDLWRGSALFDLAEWEPGRVEAARLEELRLDAEEARIDAGLRCGQHREVMGDAQARVAEAPLRERRWALLALAQYQSGRQGEALRTLRQARNVLASELGLDPGPELVALEQAILRQDPDLLIEEAGSSEASRRCPYPGLVAYDVADSDGFFGRDAEVVECLRRLAGSTVLAVVGPSGCGKSSLVRAGVAAALERSGRRVMVVTPGDHPMDVLTWLPTGGETVLVVDQCEEAVVLCADPAERARFFAALVERAAQSHLVVALRADRLGDLSGYPEFARLVERDLYLLGAMAESSLRAAIEGPARLAGLLMEPGLVDLLVREVEREPAALPLLSHALRRTWERREGRTLTVAGYQATGGIREAVAQSAEEVYDTIPLDLRPALRDLFLRLVATSPDGEPFRVRVPRRNLDLDGNHGPLIERLVAARLITSDDDTVELAHESLARAWPRLRAWLDDDVEGLRILRHLTVAAQTWNTMGRPDSELYRGARLTQALDWRELAHPTLTATEHEFLDHGQLLADADEHQAEARARQQRRVNRRLRALLAGVGVLLAAALIAGLLAWRQAQRADTSAIAADARRVATLSRSVADLDEALLLAVEGVRLDESFDTRASLLAALARDPALIAASRGGESSRALAVSADGDVLVTDGRVVSRYEATTLHRRAAIEQESSQLVFRPESGQVAIVSDNRFAERPVRVVDQTSFDDAVQLGGFGDLRMNGATDLDYSADGATLAVSTYRVNREQPDQILVWEMARTDQPIQRIEADLVWAVALSPDGRLLYAMWSSWDRRLDQSGPPVLTVYDVATGQPLRSAYLPADLSPETAGFGLARDLLELNPDGTLVAVGDDRGITLFDSSTLSVQRSIRAGSEDFLTLEFSHDGTLLASGSDEDTIRLWDGRSGTLVAEFTGQSGPVRDLAFNADDGVLYSASDDGLLAWDVRGGRRFIRRLAEPQPGDHFADVAVLAPHGAAVVYLMNGPDGERHGSIRFRDLSTGDLGARITTGGRNTAFAWRPPGGNQFAIADRDGNVRVWDWRRGELAAERPVVAGSIGAIGYSSDGQRLLIGERSGAIFQVDADTLEPVGDRVTLDDAVRLIVPMPGGDRALALLAGQELSTVDLVAGRILDQVDLGVHLASLDLSPDGTRLVVGTTTGQVGVTDLRTGEWIQPPVASHDGWVERVAFSTDGARFASSGHDGRINLWDGRTAELLATIAPQDSNAWTAVEFLPDGHTIVVAGRDGGLFTWNTSVEHWIERACAVAGRNLTESEWLNAFPDRAQRDTCPSG